MFSGTAVARMVGWLGLAIPLCLGLWDQESLKIGFQEYLPAFRKRAVGKDRVDAKGDRRHRSQ